MTEEPDVELPREGKGNQADNSHLERHNLVFSPEVKRVPVSHIKTARRALFRLTINDIRRTAYNFSIKKKELKYTFST